MSSSFVRNVPRECNKDTLNVKIIFLVFSVKVFSFGNYELKYVSADDQQLRKWEKEYTTLAQSQEGGFWTHWMHAKNRNFRESVCKTIFPRLQIVGTRHLRNSKMRIGSRRRGRKIDMIMCIDVNENAFYLAYGDARHVFQAVRISPGHYKLGSGKLLHRIKGPSVRQGE